MGNCIGGVTLADSVRVVLILADPLGNAAPGFRSVVATDRKIAGNVLNLRVPDVSPG